MEHVYVNYLDDKIVRALDEYVLEQKNASYKEGYEDGNDEGYTVGYEDGVEDFKKKEEETT